MDTHSRFTVSLHYDRRLYRQDIAGSVAHARMLARQGIIAEEEAARLVEGLERIREAIEAETFPWREELEDVHMNIERRLYETVGDVAGKLHTARSRNDQVATDVRLYVKEVIDEALQAIHDLRAAFVQQASENLGVVMPGYTHVQRAQPVLFAHHMLAYFEMIGRDAERMRQARDSADTMPLGSGAMAGVPYPIDRESVARELGFGKISANSMDAVSDRDFLLDFHSAAAVCAMHLSRLAEELVLWSSDEFGFVRLDDRYTTGSSIMPQKRNPDFAEIARGKTGRVYGNLVGLLTTMKGLPLTYNRDMQEDKEGLFDTVDTLIPTLQVAEGMVSTMEVQAERMRTAVLNSYALATDVADYLVAKGLPFREAHGIVARLSTSRRRVRQTSGRTRPRYVPWDTLTGLKKTCCPSPWSLPFVHATFFGGTAPNRVEAAVEAAKAELETDRA